MTVWQQWQGQGALMAGVCVPSCHWADGHLSRGILRETITPAPTYPPQIMSLLGHSEPSRLQ